MLREKDLQDSEYAPIRLNGGDRFLRGVTLSVLAELFPYVNEHYGLPVALTQDQVSGGSIFRPTVEDCLVLTNTEHPKDYFKMVLLLRRQGKFPLIYQKTTGTSKALATKMRVEGASAKRGKDYGAGYRFATKLLSGNYNNQLEVEAGYYTILEDLIHSWLGAKAEYMEQLSEIMSKKHPELFD